MGAPSGQMRLMVRVSLFPALAWVVHQNKGPLCSCGLPGICHASPGLLPEPLGCGFVLCLFCSWLRSSQANQRGVCNRK